MQQVAHIDKPFDVVDLVAKDGQPRMLGLEHHIAGLAGGRGIGQGHDFRARGHDFFHSLIAELKHRVNQLALFLFDDAFGFADIDQRLDVVAIIIFFFFGICFIQFFLLPQAVKRAMPRLSGKSEGAIKGPQQGQEPQQLSLRITQRDQTGNELTKYPGQHQT